MKYARTSMALAGAALIFSQAWPVRTAGAQIDEFKVNTDNGTAYQGYSACATAADGSFAVAWEDGRNGGVDIFAQRFNPEGLRLGGNVRVNGPTLPDQYAPAMAIDPGATIWIAWQDYRASGYPNNGDMYLQRISSAGALQGGNVMINDDGSEATQKEPAIAVGNAGALVVWSDLRNGQWEIFAQKLDLAGNTQGTNFQVSAGAAGPQHSPAVAVVSDSAFVVAWYDTRSGDEDVYFQLVAADGTVSGSSRAADRAGDGIKQRFPAVSARGSSGFTLAWEDFREGAYPTGGRIYKREFDLGGVPADTALATSGTAYDQNRPRLTGDLAGNRVVVWEEQHAGIRGVYQRKLLAGADLALAVTEVGSTSATATRSRPQIAIGAGKVIYTWTDLRNGHFDVYAAVETYRFPSFLPVPSAIQFAVPLRAPQTTPTVLVHVQATGAAPIEIQFTDLPAWLAVEPTIAVTPADFTFIVTAPLPAGDTTVLVYATNTAAPTDREPLTVSMDLLIPVITALPDRVELLIDETADSMLVQVNNAVAGPLEWTHTDPASPWRVTPAGAGALWVVFDPGGLGASFWEDTIWISDPLAANSPLALPLSADVEGVPPAPPFLVVAPAEVFWSARVGAATADSAFVLVSANFDTAIVWQINTWPSWLYVESNSGVTASVLTLRAARDYQPLGVYHDTLEIWSPDASNSPLKLPVTMTVDIRSAIAEEPVGVAASKPVAYPNPFNSSVLIEFGDVSSGPQDYLVLDLLGRTVDRIRLARTGTGEGVVRWSPNPGRPSGVYFIRRADDSKALPVRVLYLK